MHDFLFIKHQHHDQGLQSRPMLKVSSPAHFYFEQKRVQFQFSLTQKSTLPSGSPECTVVRRYSIMCQFRQIFNASKWTFWCFYIKFDIWGSPGYHYFICYVTIWSYYKALFPWTFGASLRIYKVKRKIKIKFSIRAYTVSSFWGLN